MSSTIVRIDAPSLKEKEDDRIGYSHILTTKLVTGIRVFEKRHSCSFTDEASAGVYPSRSSRAADSGFNIFMWHGMYHSTVRRYSTKYTSADHLPCNPERGLSGNTLGNTKFCMAHRYHSVDRSCPTVIFMRISTNILEVSQQRPTLGSRHPQTLGHFPTLATRQRGK